MRDKQFIYGMAGLLAIILIALVVVLFWPAGTEQVPTTTEDPFADTSAERPITLDPNVDPFANMAPGWIENGEGGGATQPPKLRMVHAGPVLRPVVHAAQSASGAVPTVRFTDRTNGHIFETPLQTVADNTKILDKTLQRVADVTWAPGGTAFLYRYLPEENDSIFSYLGGFATSAGAAFSGKPLQNEITSAAFSPTGGSLLYIAQTADGPKAYLESIVGGSRSQVWTPPLRGVTVSWTNPNTVVAYTNPAEEASGVVWFLDTTDWSERVVMGREHGMSASLSPNGDVLLYSFIETGSRVWSLRTMRLEDGQITYLPMPTITEKCAWAPGETRYLYCAVPRNLNNKDWLMRWQQGRLQSDDVLWRFDVITGEANLVLDPVVEAKVSFDMIDLMVDDTHSFLVFRTKDRQMLWAVRLSAPPISTSVSTTATTTTP